MSCGLHIPERDGSREDHFQHVDDETRFESDGEPDLFLEADICYPDENDPSHFNPMHRCPYRYPGTIQTCIPLGQHAADLLKPAQAEVRSGGLFCGHPVWR